MRILISDVVSLLKDGSSQGGHRVDIGVEKGEILFIEEHISWDSEKRQHQGPWDRIIDGCGRLVLPGFVNAHTHLGMTLLRGYGDDLPLMTWLQEKMWPVEEQLTPEDVYWSALLAVAEMIKGGVTTCADMYFHMEAVAEAAAESGIRAFLSRGIQDAAGSGLQGLGEAVRFCRQWQGAADGRITTAIGPHAPYTCSPELLQRTAAWAAQLEGPIHIHVAETTAEVEEIAARYGTTPLGMLAANGILDLPVTAAHCVHMEEADILLAAEKDVRLPTVQPAILNWAAVLPRCPRCWGWASDWLGTDSAASNNRLDLWQKCGRPASCTREVTRTQQ